MTFSHSIYFLHISLFSLYIYRFGVHVCIGVLISVSLCIYLSTFFFSHITLFHFILQVHVLYWITLTHTCFTFCHWLLIVSELMEAYIFKLYYFYLISVLVCAYPFFLFLFSLYIYRFHHFTCSSLIAPFGTMVG